jgi:predicted dehydrogenase
MTLRLAILGYGFIADLHARAARDCGLDVVVVAGENFDRARAFAQAHDIGRSASMGGGSRHR